MSFSAVSLAILAMAPVQQAPQRENTVWRTVRNSIVFVQDGRDTVGVGALIDDQGHFLVHSSAVRTKTLKAKYDDGKSVDLLVIGTDDHTQLALVRALYWEQGTRRVLKVAAEPTKPNVELLAVTVGGPKTGEFVGDGKAGVMKPSLRYVPLSEVRLEASEQQLGGAIVFDDKGDVVGVLGATLATDEASPTGAARNALGGGGFGETALNALKNQYGPQGVVVAYALGREVLQRVVGGFVSPSHEVAHPTIGVFWKANPEGKGAVIEAVMTASPASAGGIKPGDVVVEIDGQAVNTPVDMAVLLFRKNVGDTVQIVYLRGTVKGTTRVKVAGSQSELSL